MKLRLFQVDAFASRPFAGNPAAVVPLERWLDDRTLQAIASENNLSETAFLVPRGRDYDIRWMTPTDEVDDAIRRGDFEGLRDELGDLLLQVVFHADIARERGAFRLAEVVARVSEKMVRRHPHVFADDGASTSGEVLRSWEAIKASERQASGKDDESMLDSVHRGLPAVMEAFQMTTKVSRVGFDWAGADPALVKLDEEALELREAIRSGEEKARIAEEVGDLLFVAVNVARLTGVDPESALKAANRKFRRRFRHVEERLREKGQKPADSTLDEMDRLWDEAKAQGL